MQSKIARPQTEAGVIATVVAVRYKPAPLRAGLDAALLDFLDGGQAEQRRDHICGRISYRCLARSFSFNP